MTATTDTSGASTPWHYWVVTIIAVLWNGFGGFDYVMSHTQAETWLGTPEKLAALAAYPTWMHAVWAIGVWGSVLGAILLVLRRRWALHAFAASTLGALGSLIFIAVTPQVKAAFGIEVPVVILAGCLFFTWYSRLIAQRGVLR